MNGLDRYEQALLVHVPMREPPELRQMRRRLMAARDYATRALSNAYAHTDDALAVHHVVLNVASRHCFAFIGTDEIERAVRVCVSLAVAASTINQMGGTDGTAS